ARSRGGLKVRRVRRFAVRSRAHRAVLVHPGTAHAPASVLPGRVRPAAALASLADGTRRVAVGRRNGRVFQTQSHRAGAGHGNPDPARAEMLEMRLTYALVDLHPLLLAAQVIPPPLSSLARQQEARAWVQN